MAIRVPALGQAERVEILQIWIATVTRSVTAKEIDMRTVRRLVPVLLVLALTKPAFATNAIHKVNCDKKSTIADALKHADPGDTIRVTGVCTEQVVIRTSRLTLEAEGTAVLDGTGAGSADTGKGGVLVVDGARGVVITGLTVQHGVSHGINGRAGATLTVKNVVVQDNGAAGIFLQDNASAELDDTVVQRNDSFGIGVHNNSTLVVRGKVLTTANRIHGIELSSGAALEIRGGSVQATRNGQNGVDAVDSQIVIFGFSESQGSMLSAIENRVDGIFVASGGLNAFGGGFASSGTFTIIASRNGGSGISLDQAGTVISPYGAAKFVLENNVTGLTATDQARALIVGGLQVQHNQMGLRADGAGTLTLVSITPNPSSIKNNSGTDVDLRFGTRATIIGVSIGTIVCDTTVLSRGSTVCP